MNPNVSVPSGAIPEIPSMFTSAPSIEGATDSLVAATIPEPPLIEANVSQTVEPVQPPVAIEPTLFSPAEANVPVFGSQLKEEQKLNPDDIVPTAFAPLNSSSPEPELPGTTFTLPEGEKAELTGILNELDEANRIAQEALREKIIDVYCRLLLKDNKENEIRKAA